jgi:hypothetical protein
MLEHPAARARPKGDPMAKRRPRRGQNAQARTVAGAVLVSLAVLITGLMFFQTFGPNVGAPIA